jgi:small subunit ribosomal protein S5
MAKREQGPKQGKEHRSDSEWSEKVLYINRCSKVVKGGRKFSFSALILVGDGKGRIGYGFAKANELTDAIRKGGEAARKNLITFEMEGTTIPHEVTVQWDGACAMLKPAKEGTGVIAGSHMRSVLEAAGIKDVVAKSLGTSNPVNLVRATFKALKSLRNRKQVMQLRGVTA